jgi:HSP20 family molecular chaperone IbpA
LSFGLKIIGCQSWARQDRNGADSAVLARPVTRSSRRSDGMNRLSPLRNPLLLGFDEFERTLERITKASSDGYPPYNIERTGETRLRITLAVAGFTRDDLDIQLEDNQLTVSGQQAAEDDREYLHRGIATRMFRRSFVLADGVEVSAASLDNGLLNIDVVLPQPERNIRKIEIGGDTGEASGITVDTKGEVQ